MVGREIVDRLDHALDESLRSSTEDLNQVAISFSGGLDSSIMAFYASKHTNPMLYVVGEEDSADMQNARQASKILGLPLIEIGLMEDKVRKALPIVVNLVKSSNPVLVSYKIPEYYVSKAARESTILLGNGADELFGGYARYAEMKSKELEENMRSDLESLLREEIPIDDRISRSFGKRFEYPFLSANIIEIAMNLPTNLKVGSEGRKTILRKLAERIGLPQEISTRRKKAAQYGAGIIRIMRRVAKRDGMSISRYIEKLADF